MVHGRGFCGTERDGGTRLVHGRGFCGTERGEGHGWYTGRDSEVRNGIRGIVGTQKGLLRYGTRWRTRLVHRRGT